MPVSATYSVELDINRNDAFDHANADITNYVLGASWTNGMADSYDTYANPASLTITLNNSSGAFNVEDSGALYYDVLRHGLLVRICATDPTTTTTHVLCKLKLSSVRVSPGAYSSRTIVLTCTDPMGELLLDNWAGTIYTNTTADVILTDIFGNGVVVYPYDGYWWLLGIVGSSELGQTTILFDPSTFTNFETGNSTLVIAGDNIGSDDSAQTLIREIVLRELGRFYWDVRTSKAVFHSRQHDLGSTSSLTLTQDEIYQPTEYIVDDDMVNKYLIDYEAREIGAADSVIWSNDSVPISIDNGASVEYKFSYSNVGAVDQTGTVYSNDAYTPIAGVDVIANTASDGSGTDASGSMAISATIDIDGATVTVVNNYGSTVYITTLQMRGTPLTIYPSETYETVNIERIASYDKRSQRITARLLESEEAAASYAKYLVSNFSRAQAGFKSVTIDTAQSTDLMTAGLTFTVGTVITITESFTTHNDTYLIVGERHSYVPGGVVNGQQYQTHMVTWILRPFSTLVSWKLGVAGLSELGETTILAY